jgi:Flp pilus assembly protein TadB
MEWPQLDSVAAGLTGVCLGISSAFLAKLSADRSFERERAAVAERMQRQFFNAALDHRPVVVDDDRVPDEDDRVPDDDELAPVVVREDDDQFAAVLIEYYSYGLTQARRSFYTSQVISAVGVFVILFGVVLAIWRAETTGDMFASIVTSSAGVISTVIGQLVHRRADIALKHMADQTESLRADMRAERSGDQAIELLAQVADPEVRTRLQAGLIMKLSGASMPEIGAAATESVPRPSSESATEG